MNTHSWQRWLIITSQSPNSSTSKWQCGNGSLLIRICGTSDGSELGISATGLTFSELPITKSKSHLFLSSVTASWNESGSPSPKNTMSGFMIPAETKFFKCFCWLSVEMYDSDAGWHLTQIGICCARTVSRMASAVTLCPHFVQVAVENEPWHSMTRSMLAHLSSVSMFWV